MVTLKEQYENPALRALAAFEAWQMAEGQDPTEWRSVEWAYLRGEHTVTLWIKREITGRPIRFVQIAKPLFADALCNAAQVVISDPELNALV